MSPTTLAPAGTDPNVEAAGGDRFVVHRPPRRYPEPLPTGEVVAASLLLSLAAAAVPPLRRRRASRRARDRYLDHLDTVAGTLARAAAVQRAAAAHLFPDLPEILAIAGGGERLWGRRRTDEDFLAVRAGRWTWSPWAATWACTWCSPARRAGPRAPPSTRSCDGCTRSAARGW
jgi:hypothetical protein